MKKYHLLFLFIFVFNYSFSQNNKLWKAYYSYNYIKAISETDSGIVAASENALFTKNYGNEELNTINTLDGLSGSSISALYHSKKTKYTIIGYTTGLIQIADSKGVFNIVDIQNKVGILPTKKIINNFNEYENKLYIATGFGISVFDLQKLQFIDTYFIGDNGAEIEILETTIVNKWLYAVTKSNGIKKIRFDDSAILDYKNWTQVHSGSWMGIVNFNNIATAFTFWDNVIATFDGENVAIVGNVDSKIVNTSATTDYLVVTTTNSVTVYDTSFKIKNQVKAVGDLIYTDAIISNNQLYIGTQTEGVIQTSILDASTSIKIKPDGPIRNTIFAIKSTPSKLWAVYGDYNDEYDPYPLDSYGISSLTYRKGWEEIPYENLFEAKSIVRIIADPKDENHLYFSSHFSGLLEMKNNVFTTIYNTTNSDLETLGDPLKDNDIRIHGSAFDEQGNLWVTNAFLKNGLKKMDPTAKWESFQIDKSAPFQTSYSTLIIDKNNTKWIASNKDGVIGYNEKLAISLKSITTDNNLPSNDVRAIAIDNTNQLWIGTNRGLRILPSIDQFTTSNNLKTNNIVILDDGLGQELLFEQFITDIIVDGANRKWIATADSGLFYLSSNGQQTIYHFTDSDSPLPSNGIKDLELNKDTGELFIVTDKGMVSFFTNVTDSNPSLDNVLVYPNPVRPDYTGMITVGGLIDKANIKITDITGSLVFQATAEGGSVQWDGTAFGQYKVATGVYLVFVVTEDGNETQAKKIMIVR